MRREAGTLSVRLAYRPPYDWDAMLSFLIARAIPGVELVSANAYRRTIAIGAHCGVIGVTPADKHRVDVKIRFPDMAALPQIIARVRRVFDLAADPDTIGTHLALDPALAPLVRARPGLRVPGAWDGFELAMRAVFGQQITVPAATKLLGKLVQAYGDPLPAGDSEGLTHLFHRPELPARISPHSACPAPARSASALAVIAAIRRSSAAAPAQGCDRKLRALPGIGEWTAQYRDARIVSQPLP